MNIFPVLQEFELSVCIRQERRESQRRPGVFYDQMVLELTDNKAEPAASVVVDLPTGADDPLVAGVVKALRQRPSHPALRTWYDQCGNTAVTIQEHAVEAFGEAFFSAVRKCCDSPESSLLWNAQTQLDENDWSELLRASRDALAKLVESTKGKTLTRRAVGLALQEVWTDKAHELWSRGRLANSDGSRERAHRRSKEQLFTLLAVLTAARTTPLEEVVFGWTAFLCKDVTTEVTPEVAP